MKKLFLMLMVCGASISIASATPLTVNVSGASVIEKNLAHEVFYLGDYGFSDLSKEEYRILIYGSGSDSKHVTSHSPESSKMAHLERVSGSTNKYLLTVYNRGTSEISIRIYNESNTLIDRKSTRLNSSHVKISYAVFC